MSAEVLSARGVRIVVSATGADIVRDVDFSVRKGEVVGLVGESGAGKTALALALLGYARPGSAIVSGEVRFDGLELLAAGPVVKRDVLGRRMAFVPQNPGAALNPCLRVGGHLEEVLALHAPHVRRPKEEIDRILASVALPVGPEFRARFPHQLSGGQQQRIAIALAIACRPELVVLDEPTTGLDVTTQAQVLTLMDGLRRELHTALVYVSHNLAVIAEIADRVAVMYGGTIVESGPKDALFAQPRHPYTRMLIDAVPSLEGERRALIGIPGLAPAPGAYGDGCTFVARCPHADPSRCLLPQPAGVVGPDHEVRCVRWAELDVVGRAAEIPELRHAAGDARAALLRVRGLRATYPGRHATTVAVDDVSLDVQRGECLAVVGESGSGKSTLARCVAGLHRDWSGLVELDGVALPRHAGDRSRELRRRIQLVFQNPDRSLNPQQRVATIIGRPCRLLAGMSAEAARARAVELLELVRLSPRYADVYPTELSGGQRQRVAIARALAADGELLICDEVTSALDVSVQASLLELLFALRQELTLSLLFVSHDLSVVRSIADRIVVLRRGALCETNDVEALFGDPGDDYTRALIDAAPRMPAHHP